jgi:hypothetical protein
VTEDADRQIQRIAIVAPANFRFAIRSGIVRLDGPPETVRSSMAIGTNIFGWEVTVEIDNPPERSPAELLLQDTYTPEELATLLEMDVNLIRHSAYTGQLEARILDHNIISITRTAALRWLDSRE